VPTQAMHVTLSDQCQRQSLMVTCDQLGSLEACPIELDLLLPWTEARARLPGGLLLSAIRRDCGAWCVRIGAFSTLESETSQLFGLG